MQMITRGMEDTLIRIQSPRKERGTSTLKRGDWMWNYFPKVRKVVRIPPSMMTSSWMGSDLTNDDLVRSSSWEDDYTVSLAGKTGEEVCLKYTPREDAPVTWSKVEACFNRESKLPEKQLFYDEKGRKVRRMTFGKVREMDGRTIPTRITIEPLSDDKEGHRTVMTYEEIDFNVEVSPATFSMANLRRGR